MAVKGMVLGCDWCEKEEHGFDTEDDAVAHGWWIGNGPHPRTEEPREFAFCKGECLASYVDYYACV